MSTATDLFGAIQGKRLLAAQETVGAILVLLVKRSKGNRVSIGVRQIADESGVSTKAVKKWIKRLVSSELLTVVNKGVWKYRTTEYELSPTATEMGAHSYYVTRPADAGEGVLCTTYQAEQDRTDNQTERMEHICIEQHREYTHSSDALASVVLLNGHPSTCDCNDWTDLPSVPDNGVVLKVPPLVDVLLNGAPSNPTDWKRLRKQRAREENIRRANRFLSELWQQVSTGQSCYPVHPDVLRVLRMSDADRDRWERETGYPPEDRVFAWDVNDKLHSEVDPPWSPQYAYLFQPDVKHRPRCKDCKRSMYLTVLKYPLGAVKYVCKNSKGHKGLGLWTFRDLWWQYRVYNNGEQTDLSDSDRP